MTPAPAPSVELIDRIMAVMEAAFDPAYGEAWNRRQVADALTLPSTHALVVDAAGAPIADGPGLAPAPAGFVLTRHVLDEEELHFWNICSPSPENAARRASFSKCAGVIRLSICIASSNSNRSASGGTITGWPMVNGSTQLLSAGQSSLGQTVPNW
jgi:hypothetical protein